MNFSMLHVFAKLSVSSEVLVTSVESGTRALQCVGLDEEINSVGLDVSEILSFEGCIVLLG